MHRLPVGRILREAFGFTGRELRGWATIALIPILLNVAVILGYHFLFAGRGAGWLPDLLRNILTMVIDVPFLAAWHRMTLLGPQRAQGVVAYAYRGAEKRFLGFLMMIYLFFLGGMILAPALLVPLAAGRGEGAVLLLMLGLFATLIALTVVGLRWSMVFPAAAVGERIGLARSWQLTRGNGLRLYAVMLGAFLPLIGLGVVMVLVLGLEYAMREGYVMLELLMLVPGFFFGAVLVSALSMAYWHLTGYDPDAFDPQAILKR